MQDNTLPGLYSIVFITYQDYKFASTLNILDFDTSDAEGIELFWNSREKRDKAVRFLEKEYDITVDTFDFV